MKKNKQKKILMLLLLFFCVCNLCVGCHNKPTPDIINPNTVGLNKEIKDLLLSGKPVVLVLGTGLCENCKIVKDIVNKLKETRKDMAISWFVYEDYRDRTTFQVFNLSISPTTFLIGTDHQVLKRIIGTFTEQELLENLKDVGLIH